MALNTAELQSIIQLIHRDPEVRRQFQAALQLNGLLETPTRLDRIEAAIEQLVEAQRRSEERFGHVESRLDRVEARLEKVETRLDRVEARLEKVEARLDRVEARLEKVEARLEKVEARLEKVEMRLERIEAIVEKLAEAQLRTEVEVREVKVEVMKISDRLRGEDGRRAGEQYERTIERRAPFLLGGGTGGGTRRDAVYARVQHLLAQLYRTNDLPSEADPMLADLIWWKGDRYAVVEVSIRVDRLDVLRAAQRARTLRAGGSDALGVVIGDEWLAEDTRALAQEEAVEWKVGNSYSPGLIDYRRIDA